MNRDRMAAIAASILRDLTGFAGGALIVTGVSEWSRPAAMIIAGAAMLAISILLARRAG